MGTDKAENLMTKRDVETILIQNGIRGEVHEDGRYSFRITTEHAVPESVKSEIDMKRPAGYLITYGLRPKDKVPVPAILSKWYQLTSKYMKGDT